MNLLNRLTNPRTKLFFTLGFFTSLRVGDIISLQWEEIIDKEFYTPIEQKTNKFRRIYFAPELIAQIKESSASMGSTGYIFKPLRGPKRDHITVNSANRLIKKIFAQHSIETKLNDSSHLLRKTWARRAYDTLKMDIGESEALIYLSKILKHTNLDVTKAYIGLTEEVFENLFKNINKCQTKAHLEVGYRSKNLKQA